MHRLGRKRGRREEVRFARGANNPPYAMKLQRVGHPASLGYPVSSLGWIPAVAQLQSHAPLVRFAKAPVPPPLHAQAERFAAEQEDGVATLQSAQ